MRQRKTGFIQAKVTETELLAIHRWAEHLKISVSDLLRMAVNEKLLALARKAGPVK